MRNFLKIGENVQIQSLLLALYRFDKSDDIWKEDTYLRDYPQGPFGDTESVILRFPPRSVVETEEALKNYEKHIDQHENVDQPVFKLMPEARPLIFNLMAAIQGERLGRVLINKLKPGGKVFPHADTPVHAEYWDRFHIVLQSLPGNVFRCGDETVMMKTGECWWFNNLLEHEVTNNSADDRINMVVDIRTAKKAIDASKNANSSN